MLQVAWKFIKFDKAKSIGVIVGILISTFLIGQQLGILIFLTNAMQALATNVKADIWVVDNKTKDVNQLGKLDIRTLRSVQSFPGIQQAFPVLITGASCNFQNGTSAAITIIGVDMTQLKYILDSNKIIAGKTEDLQMDGAISGEFFEKKNLGDNLDLGTEFEINGKRAYFALQTKGFRGFGSSFCITTIERARYYANTSKTSISAVLVKLSPGANPDTIASEISTGLFGVTAWPSKKLGYSTVKKILSSSGIALSTGTLIIFALVSGFFIIGLTMYSSALDRLKDYGILKAIGAGNKYIRKLILLQAILFAIVGFTIGMLLLEGFRKGVAHSGLVFQFSTSLIFLILMTIVLISIGGASFALRRISSVEPAAVFR
jgi:putative ABC transport system permease protein